MEPDDEADRHGPSSTFAVGCPGSGVRQTKQYHTVPSKKEKEELTALMANEAFA